MPALQPSFMPARTTDRAALRVNRNDRLEWADAFGDLGTLMQFVIAYICVMKLDPVGVLFGFGVSMMVCRWSLRQFGQCSRPTSNTRLRS